MIDGFVARLRKVIDEERKLLADSIARGDANSFEEYRYMAGRIRELDFVTSEINVLYDAINEE